MRSSATIAAEVNERRCVEQESKLVRFDDVFVDFERVGTCPQSN